MSCENLHFFPLIYTFQSFCNFSFINKCHIHFAGSKEIAERLIFNCADITAEDVKGSVEYLEF